MGLRTTGRYEINHSVVLTKVQQEYIYCAISQGIGIKDICTKLNIPVHHIYDYAFKDPQFTKLMERARVIQSHLLVDELMHVTKGAETMAQVQNAKVWSDNAKWVASKIVPATYGDSLNVNVTHLDLSSVLLAAENRVMSVIDAKSALVVDAEVCIDDRSSLRIDSGASILEDLEGLGDIPAELEDLI